MTAAAMGRADADVSAPVGLSKRVRRIGSFIQVAFAAFWLIRGGPNVRGAPGIVLAFVAVAITIVVVYGVRATAGAVRDPPVPK